MAGRLEIVCGPVGSGKSQELERRLFALQQARMPFLLFRPDFLHSKMQDAIKTGTDKRAVEFMMHVAGKFPEAEAISVDGANFYSLDILHAVETWMKKKRVICAGLDTDFAGKPFETMAMLLAIADDIHKLSAICTVCKKTATRSQIVEIDTKLPQDIAEQSAFYEPRCLECHQIPQDYMPKSNLRWMMER
ncbi:MAG: hypothetical protein HYW25_03690 [Candidatus Aenigmarchaeota archaeon]|nr:hypothetical protein [Candidatus Aenigmarchaeota archaeon]